MKYSNSIIIALLMTLVAFGPVYALPPLEMTGTPDTAFFSRNGTSSRSPVLGPDGTWVAWYSDADDLVPGDDNGDIDVFAREISRGETTCVSVSEEGKPAGVRGEISFPRGLSVSAGGEFIAFVSYGDDGKADVLVRDMRKHRTLMVSMNPAGEPGNGPSLMPSISRNGRYVAFASAGSNLTDGDTNGFTDIFVRNIETGTLERISAGVGGAEPDGDSTLPSISWDGRMIAFSSKATNLVPDHLAKGSNVYVFDRSSGKMTLVSVSSSGKSSNTDSFSLPASISGDGRSVLFRSAATNLVASDSNLAEDLFIRDLDSNATLTASMGDGLAELSNGAFAGAVGFRGEIVAFLSDSDHIARGDVNHGADVFIRYLQTLKVEMASISSDGSQIFAESSDPSLSGNGCMIAFSARPLDLLTGNEKDTWEVFIHDIPRRKTFWISAPAGRP